MLFDRARLLAAQVLHRGSKTNRARDIGRASAEFACRVLELLRAKVDRVRHVRAGLIRGHVIQQLTPRPEDADPHGSEHLVAREREEVAAQSPDIEGNVGSGLCGVDQHAGPDALCACTDLGGWIDEARDVGDVTERYNLRVRRELALQIIEAYPTLVVYVDVAKCRSGLLGNQPPRQEVRGVLGDREEYLVARSKPWAPPG